MKDTLQLKDVSTAEGQMVSIDLKDIPELPLDVKTMPWKPFTDEQKQNTACILDEVCVLNIPMPKNKEEEEEMVNKFLNGMRKLFSKENNWTFLPMLETSMDYCAQCNSCSEACHPVRDVRQKRNVPAQLPVRDISPHLQAVCEKGTLCQMALRRHGP